MNGNKELIGYPKMRNNIIMHHLYYIQVEEFINLYSKSMDVILR